MSVVCILKPVIMIAGWPAFSAAAVAAAHAQGYEAVAELERQAEAEHEPDGGVKIEIERSELVTAQLGRDQRLSVTRDGITITFSRDSRGRAQICVTGDGYETGHLRAMGEQMSKAVVQHYVYQRLQEEMRVRGFNVVEKEVAEDGAIRMKVRHWEQ